MSHPDYSFAKNNITAAFREGVSAFRTGVQLKDNPHKPYSEKSRHWFNGWTFASGGRQIDL